MAGERLVRTGMGKGAGYVKRTRIHVFPKRLRLHQEYSIEGGVPCMFYLRGASLTGN